MTTALERAVDALSDPNVATADALRGLLVVVRRIGAVSLGDWISHELNGYRADDRLPPYRQKDLPIKLHFDGPLGSSTTMTVYAAELPDHLASIRKAGHIVDPVAELEALAGLVADPEQTFPSAWVTLYRRAINDEEAPGMAMMILNRAGFVIPRTYIRGLLDGIKTTALELALQLEDVSPQVGQVDGPTVSTSQELATKVDGVILRVFGDGNTIVVGDSNTVAAGKHAQAITLQAGDVGGLLTAARTFVDEDAIAELAQAIDEDGGAGGDKTRKWLERVKRGGYTLAGGIATDGAYEGLHALLQSVFPHLFGG